MALARDAASGIFRLHHSHPDTPPTEATSWPVETRSEYWGRSCTCGRTPLRKPATAGYRLADHTECPVCLDPWDSWKRRDLKDELRLTTRAGALLQGGDDAIVATEWWHTTQYPVSGAEAFDPSKIQHVGTEDAARHRMVSRENIDLMGDGKCRDLYRIRLSPGVTVLPEIVVESFSSFLIYFRPEPKTVLRYINAYEAPGDISLFLGADAIQDVELVGQVCNRTVRVAAERRLVPLAEIR